MTPDRLLQLRMEVCGMIADAASSHRTGGELALFQRRAFARIDAIWLELFPPPKPAVQNGQPAAPAAQQVKR